MRLFQRKTWIVAAILLLSKLGIAQTQPVIDSVLKGRDGKLIVGAQALVRDVVYYDPVLSPTILATNKVSNIVTFRIDEYSTRKLPDSFKVSALVRIIYIDAAAAKDSVEKTLNITYYKAKPYTGRAYFNFNNGYEVNVKVLQLTAQYAALDSVITALDLENELVVDRDFKVDCGLQAIKTISKDAGQFSTTGELSVYWTSNRAAEEYDLEWTYIDSSALESGVYNNGSGQLDANLLFRFNATQVTVAGNSYAIPMLFEGGGVLFFRVRGAETISNGQRYTTPWSSDYISDGGLGSHGFFGHERKLNWQVNTSFAEEGKRKSVVQYFDGSLKARQTVTKDNTTQTTVVAETLYDKQGRPVIQVLPAPTMSSLLKFTPGFNTLNSAEYDKGIYDTLTGAADYCESILPAMDSTSGAAKYYSIENAEVASGRNKYIPNAYGFAFTQTKYTQDNTGRINRQGGVGKTFQLSMGHETKYYYGSPDQEELDALFGTEAGEASHYQKNMVRDANGQYSVSYVDMHGRTVATALAGETPASLDQLASYRNATATTSLLNRTNNIIKGLSIESMKGLVVTKAGTHTFNYQLNAESLGLQNCDTSTICYDCLYDLDISITDDCNNQNMPGDTAFHYSKSNFKLDSIDATCAPAVPLSVSFSLSLPEGSYTITKKLSVNEEALQHYRDSVFMVQNHCKSYEDILQEQLALIKTQLGNCAPDVLNTSDDQSKRVQMLLDVTPGIGQYGDITRVQEGFSIFNDLFYFYRFQDPALQYLDDEGKPAMVEVERNGEIVLRKPNELSQEEFTALFQPSWAETLITIHPEYKMLQDYEKLRSSLSWNNDFENTDTYAAAVTKGYLNPTGNSSTAPASSFTINMTDPLFTALSSSFSSGIATAARQSLDDSLRLYKTNGITTFSAWGVATAFAKCPDANPMDQDCANTWNMTANVFSNTLCEGELNMAWRNFRATYLQFKSNWIDNFIRNRYGVVIPPAYAAVFPDGMQVLADAGYGYGADLPTMVANNNAEIAAGIEASCLEYVQRWVLQLGPCNYAPSDLTNIIIPQLVEVCKQGGDITHPYGASTVKPGSVGPYKSFDEVIQAYNLAHGLPYNATCNGYLIDVPKPYTTQFAVVDQPTYQRPDDCTCERITQLRNQYLGLTAQYSSFSNFLLLKYKTVIRQGALDTLLNLCNGTITCKYIPQQISIPPILQCISAASDVCVDCNQFRGAYNSFTQKFPGTVPAMDETDSAQTRINLLFQVYMNSKLGFSKSAAEYLAFKDSCGGSFGTATCDTLRQIETAFHSYYDSLLSYTSAPAIPDANGCNTRHWNVSVNNYNPSYSYKWNDFFQSGTLKQPNDSTVVRVDYDYNPPLFDVTKGYTIEMRLKAPVDSTKKARYTRNGGDSTFYSSFGFNAYTTEQTSFIVTKRRVFSAFPGYIHTQRYSPAPAYPGSISFVLPDSTLAVDYSDWRVVKLKYGPSYDTFFVDNVARRSFYNPFPRGSFNYFSIIAYGYDAQVDWVKFYDETGTLRYTEEFNNCSWSAPTFDRSNQYQCDTVFRNYFNARRGTSYSVQQLDSLYRVNCGHSLNVCDTVSTGDNLRQLIADYRKDFIDPVADSLDLEMRTTAGNKTPAAGPKGVFNIGGKLIGKTTDGTLLQINQSYATIWNSDSLNALTGNLTALSNGKFRLRLRSGKQAPCNGIVGMRYYQADVSLKDTLKLIQLGIGSFVDFGDSTSIQLNYNSVSNAKNDLGRGNPESFYEQKNVVGGDYPPHSIFYLTHYYPHSSTRITRTVTVYHPDVKGVVGFHEQEAMPAPVMWTNLRGYFPQQLLRLGFYGTGDSTMNRTREIKNFAEINSIVSLEIAAGGGRPFLQNNFGDFSNNHNMRRLRILPNYRLLSGYVNGDTIAASVAGKTFDQNFPNFSSNFSRLGHIYFSTWDGREKDLLKFTWALPSLKFLFMPFNNNPAGLIDSIYVQLARVNTKQAGHITFYGGGSIPATGSAGTAAQQYLRSRGWRLADATYGESAYAQEPEDIFDTDELPLTNQFTEYYNARYGKNLTRKQLDDLYVLRTGAVPAFCSPLPLNNAALLLCGNLEAYSPDVALRQPDACSDSSRLSVLTATEIFRAYTDSLKGRFNEAYMAKCLNAVNLERFTVSRPVSEYHYTLYYYDQAGNLIKTISPEGVVPNRDSTWLADVQTKRAANQTQVPAHNLAVVYRYNSLNQVVTQNSPDGGYSRFWYDRLGRLVVSQNAKQQKETNYSYTKYDFLGRITEVGEKYQATAMLQTISRSRSSLDTWLNSLYTVNSVSVLAQQVTRTVYDIEATVSTVSNTTAATFRQKGYTLRNRVSNTLFYDYLEPVSGMNLTPKYSLYTSGSYYSYDIHGNVDTLLQHFRTGIMQANGTNQYKLIAYNYDLISGKVNQVHYQPGEKDQFFHRYEYDAENRITDVYTTNEKEFVGLGNNEEKDAHYEYYKHGPLARMVVGQQQVQGVDYAYTLQGWLKGVNSTSADTTTDMGRDGKVRGMTAKDAYGFNLNYYTGDYAAINTGENPFPGFAAYLPGGHTNNELFNGNISSMAVNIAQLAQPQLYKYKYDQLNRLTGMDVFRGYNVAANNWSAMSYTTDYKERVRYDGNGNILSYVRNGAGGSYPAMDSLQYYYFRNGDGSLRNNRLRLVGDIVPAAYYTEDIDDQLGGARPANLQPTVSTSYNVQITTPTTTASLSGSASDADGNIASLVWTKSYGGAATITSPTATSTTVTGLEPGRYIFRLTATDNQGATAFSEVTVRVLTPTGADKTLNVQLHGGSPYVNTAWNNWNITSATGINNLNYSDASASVIDASFGTTYLVADNGSGYTTTMCPSQVGRYSSYNFGSTRTLTISSLDDNKLYNFDFYASRSINSSTTRFTINGTNSTITTLNNSANKASFTNVAPASGTVTVTIWRASGDCDFVNGFTIVEQTSTGTPPSAYPTASAGVNKGITEPTATVTLVGSGYDSDGTISSYAWTKVSGDAATIMQPSAATTVINKLEPGSYVFRLTVTDNTGLTATSDVSVNVALAPGHKQLNVNVTGATSYANSEWNNWNVSSSLSVNNFNYSDGTASTIDAVLSAQTNVWDNGVGYTLGRMWPGAISRFASYNAGGSRTLTISSLDNNKKYRIRLYATNVQTTHVTRFTINGTNSDVPTYNNDSTVAIFDNLTPSSGTITVTIWRNAGSFDFLNGFTILEKGTVTGAIQDVADSNYVYDAIGNLVKDKTEKIDSIYWTVYGKISEIAKTPAGSSTVQKIKYTYDAAGNRISKLVIKQGADSTYTQYVRDAQGNVMAVYSSNTLKADTLMLNEHHLYGSSRLGIVNRELNVSQPGITGTSLNLMGMSYLSSFERGRKFFELSNHLGNVLVTVSDKKLGFDLNGDGKVDYYGADVVSALDYAPFGMNLVNRKYSAPNSSYRYGFNGKEKDNDVSGEGNQYDYGFRIYNPRLGRFLSVDPLAKSYPMFTSYQYSSNTPVSAVDIDGLESKLKIIYSQEDLNPFIIKPVAQELIKEAGMRSNVINKLIPLLHIASPEKNSLLSVEQRNLIIEETVAGYLTFNASESGLFISDGKFKQIESMTGDLNYKMIFKGKNASEQIEIVCNEFDKIYDEVYSKVSDGLDETSNKLPAINKSLKVANAINDGLNGNFLSLTNTVVSEVAQKAVTVSINQSVRAGLLPNVAKAIGARVLGVIANLLTPIEAGGATISESQGKARAAEADRLHKNVIASMLLYFLKANELQTPPIKPVIGEDQRAKKDNTGVGNSAGF